jgi:NAD(P)-dependent dehydrogenase (short-subunit alcohol dehydrogenase family)
MADRGAELGFDGKVAIITGAGGGLGRSHALDLARRGALVVVNDLGGSVDGTGSGTTAAQAVVDIVVNNAGILRDTSFKNLGPEQLEPVLDVHLKGAFYVTQPAWAHMRDQGYGRIVCTASGAGIFGNFGQTNYGAAKMGLVGLTRVLAVEGAKYNIKANAIAPVAITRMTEELLAPVADKLGPEWVTPVVTFLAHEDCPVSGEVYSVGGGRVARVFIGVTPGVVDPELEAESVRDKLDEIRKEDGYFVPANLNEEMMAALKALS